MPLSDSECLGFVAQECARALGLVREGDNTPDSLVPDLSDLVSIFRDLDVATRTEADTRLEAVLGSRARWGIVEPMDSKRTQLENIDGEAIGRLPPMERSSSNASGLVCLVDVQELARSFREGPAVHQPASHLGSSWSMDSMIRRADRQCADFDEVSSRDTSSVSAQLTLPIEKVDNAWRASVDKAVQEESVAPRHPLAPLVSAWLARTPVYQQFSVVHRASIPRFQNIKLEEARLRAAHEDLVLSQPASIGLPPVDKDGAYSCPSWLLEMYRRASRTTRIRGGMPWSFTILLGVLVHTRIEDRTGREGWLPLPLDDVISWLHPKRWRDRARDWHKLERAFNELPAYRIPVGDYRLRVVVAEALPQTYKRNTTAWFSVQIPSSAANGMRIDWPRLLSYRNSAIQTRAYLSIHALLDRSAHRGYPVTRFIREPLLNSNGAPKRGPGGRIERTDRLVENPVAHYAPFLPHRHLAGFLGLNDTPKNRHDAKRAIEKLEGEKVIDLAEERNGYRVYGPSPE